MLDKYDKSYEDAFSHFLKYSPVVASDLLRPLIVYDEGGVYLDLDIEVLNARHLYKLMLFFEYFSSECVPNSCTSIANAIFNGIKNNPVSKSMIDNIVIKFLDLSH